MNQTKAATPVANFAPIDAAVADAAYVNAVKAAAK